MFSLSDNFIEKYKRKTPPFGFNGLGLLVYTRTYSRIKEDGKNEVWWETVKRVVEGTYNIQKKWIEQNELEWNSWKAQKSAQKMFDKIFNMKFLPPGRGLWAMGSPLTEDREVFASLFNCAFYSTKNIDKEFSRPFLFMMDMSMVGVGVGFDVRGAGKITIKKPKKSRNTFIIPDSREGWVESLKILLEAYASGGEIDRFDYSLIREAGKPIKGFGGVSSGPEPLVEMHKKISESLDNNAGSTITQRTITDIMNLIGKCVVAGNVRRTAQIVFGESDSQEYLDLKNYEVNPERAEFGWASNNSVFAEIGQDYSDCAERTRINGEPGYAWLENMKNYSRMIDPPDHLDSQALGGNPCLPKWAPILTPEGLTTLGEVGPGDKIWSKEGWTTILKKWSTGVKDVYRYNATGCEFVGTDNHKVLSKGEKVPVGQAETLDRICGPSIDAVSFDQQTVMDGLVVGDGTVHKASKNLVGLIVGENDSDYHQSEISDFLIRERETVVKGFWEIKTQVTHTELPVLPSRTIPDRYVYSDFVTSCSFLRGLYSANGSICGKRVTLKSSSLQLIKQVRLMLSSIGIESYYTTNKPKTVNFSNGEYECKESYDLNITTDRERFLNVVGFIQHYKTDKLKSICEKTEEKRSGKSFDIIDTEYVSTEEVWDITVDNDSHTFWTGGCDVSNCLEQTLHNAELCCLVETFPNRHDSLEEYLETLKFAYLYGKTVTLTKTHWKETNRVMLRNRRIGTSMSGIAQFLESKGINELKTWCERGYDEIQRLDKTYSNWFAIPRSIKTTSIKPSGSVSLLAGATPGLHFPESLFYIRRMRLSIHSDLVPQLQKAGYKIEPCVGSEDSTVVVEIPVEIKGVRTVDQVSIWEQFSIAAFLQRYWADNQVSCTVTFKPEDGYEIEKCLNYFQYSLKGISLLPKLEGGAFKQMPYEAIEESEFNRITSGLSKLKIGRIRNEEADIEKFCSGDSCEIRDMKLNEDDGS